MRVDFDIKLAQEAILCGTGKVVTRAGLIVHVDRWDSDTSFPISGEIISENSRTKLSWTRKGRYYPHIDTPHDLFIELVSTIDSKKLLELDKETAILGIKCGTGRVVTREGLPVDISNWDVLPNHYIIGTVPESFSGVIKPVTITWTSEGKYWGDGGESKYDLFIEELC